MLLVLTKTSAARASIDDVDVLGNMPLVAELQLRDDDIEHLSFDLAILAQDASCHQIRCPPPDRATWPCT